ncbi:MAG: leucine-rich repeat protein [Clostridia bacterium]|nr:leucine-rich repeat protein [Clostridia bacterium]
MPFFRAFFGFLNAGEIVPKLYGIFHIVWLILVAVTIVTLGILWKKGIIKDDKRLLIVTAVVLAVFEFYKQTNVIFGDGTKIGYNFNEFPYRFNTLLIYLGIIGGMTKNKVHNSITAFIGTYLLFTGAYGLFYPQFSAVIGRNVQTMVSYGAMVVVGTFLWFSGKVKPELKTFLKALPTFLMVYTLSFTLNILPHALKINMDMGNLFGFCPVCDLKTSILRFVILSAIAFLVVLLAFAIKKLVTVDFDAEYGRTDEIAKSIRKSAGYKDEESDGVFKFSNKKDYSKNDSYMEMYFKNLHVNFGNNAKGSCGYVAIAMLLSYYDTVLRDSIVPENFDAVAPQSIDEPDFSQSPGTRFLPNVRNANDPSIEYPSSFSYPEYINAIYQAKGIYLHEKLLSIAIEKGWARIESDDIKLGAGYNIIEDMLKCYLQEEIKGISVSDYKIYGLNFERAVQNSKKDVEALRKYTDEIRAYTIKRIKEGFPVILGMYQYNPNTQELEQGHNAVAYAYDEDKDELYCHMGWDQNGVTHATPEIVSVDVPGMSGQIETFNVFDAALVLDFDDEKIRHMHSDNYPVYINGYEFYYCPEGEHGLDGSYTTRDDIIVEFDKKRRNCAIVGVNGDYYVYDKIDIPDCYGNVKVAKIHEGAFDNQKYLKEVQLPQTIDTVEENTFRNNYSLQIVVIPENIKCIKRNAFFGCTSLGAIIYYGTKAQWSEMKRVSGWDRKTGNYKIICTDGTLIKHNETKDFETLV